MKENFHEKNFDNLATPCGAPWVIVEPPRRRSARERGAPYLRENGKLASEKIWLWRHRTSVRTLRVGVSRNKFLPLSSREFCPLLFQKALEMIDKSESIYWANVQWILAADNLTFEEVIGDFRKKYSVDWFRGGKACKGIPGRNNILHSKKKFSHDRYNAEKKSYTDICQGKNS